MPELRYAAYGSNLHPVRLGQRIPSARLRGTGLLADLSLRFHKRGMDGSGKCTIRRGGSGVHVAVFTLDAADRPVLDTYEHCGIGYDALDVEVPGFGSCFTYMATTTHLVDDLVPYCWYHELVVEGCRYHGFPDDYQAKIRAIQRERDPDAARRQRHWDLIQSMRGKK